MTTRLQMLWAAEDQDEYLSEEIQWTQKSPLFSCEVIERGPRWCLVKSTRSHWTWPTSWADHVEILSFTSISEAVRLLRERGKRWTVATTNHHRRSALIAEGAGVRKNSLRKFPFEKSNIDQSLPLGMFGLLNENSMYVSTRVLPQAPLDSWNFVEDKQAPSRAYLKLYEAFSRYGLYPKPGEVCLDFGSAPGGWSWVLAQLGCQVVSIDKGEMAPQLLTIKNAKWIRKDAFAVTPQEVPAPDWLFSDLICYPDRLFDLVQTWSSASRQRPHFLCTIKFQGKTDFAALDRFLSLPGSTAIHLDQNKHEVTWIWPRKGSSFFD